MNMAMIPGGFDVEIWIQHNKHGCKTKYYWNDSTESQTPVIESWGSFLKYFVEVFVVVEVTGGILYTCLHFMKLTWVMPERSFVVLRSVLSLCSAVNPLWLIVYWLLWHFLNNSNINYIFPSQRLRLINNHLKIAVVWITTWKTELQVLTLFGQPILLVFPSQVAAAGVTAVWSMFICGFWKYRVHDFVSSVFLVKLFG